MSTNEILPPGRMERADWIMCEVSFHDCCRDDMTLAQRGVVSLPYTDSLGDIQYLIFLTFVIGCQEHPVI